MSKIIFQGAFNKIENETYSLYEKIDEAIDKQNHLLKFKTTIYPATKVAKHAKKRQLNKKLNASESTPGASSHFIQKEMNINNYVDVLSKKKRIYIEDELARGLLDKLKQKYILSQIPKKRKPITPFPFKFQLRLKKNIANTCLNTLETSSLTLNDKSACHLTSRNQGVNLNKQFYSKTLNKSLFALVKQVNTEERLLNKMNNDLTQSKKNSYSILGKRGIDNSNKTTIPTSATAFHFFPQETQKTLYTFPRVTEYITKSSRDLYAFRDVKNQLYNKYKSKCKSKYNIN